MAIEITTADSATITGIRNALNAANLSDAAQWDSVYSSTNANSGLWDYAGTTYSTVVVNSAKWSSVYTTTNSNSGGWDSVETSVRSNSASWDSAASGGVTSIVAGTNITISSSTGNVTVNAENNNWDSAYTTTQTNSANWLTTQTATDLLSSNNNLLSGCTISTSLSVRGIIYSNQLITTGTGTPTLSSGSDISLDAVTRVTVSSTPLRLVNLTSIQRDALAPLYGDLIYNTTTNRFQGYSSSGWVDLN